MRLYRRPDANVRRFDFYQPKKIIVVLSLEEMGVYLRVLMHLHFLRIFSKDSLRMPSDSEPTILKVFSSSLIC
jgi:hypothetical protein